MRENFTHRCSRENYEQKRGSNGLPHTCDELLYSTFFPTVAFDLQAVIELCFSSKDSSHCSALR